MTRQVTAAACFPESFSARSGICTEDNSASHCRSASPGSQAPAKCRLDWPGGGYRSLVEVLVEAASSGGTDTSCRRWRAICGTRARRLIADIVRAMRQDVVMAIITGGIIEGWGAPEVALRSVMREVSQFRPPRGEDDHVIDIAVRLWDPRREPQFTGVRPGMAGRRQRRFIIWHSVPAGLDDAGSVAAWLAAALPETARLVREHLPRKSGVCPSEELAAEVECLREALLRPGHAGLEVHTRRQKRTVASRAAMYKYTALRGCSQVVTGTAHVSQRHEGHLITARRPADMRDRPVAEARCSCRTRKGILRGEGHGRH